MMPRTKNPAMFSTETLTKAQIDAAKLVADAIKYKAKLGFAGSLMLSATLIGLTAYSFSQDQSQKGKPATYKGIPLDEEGLPIQPWFFRVLATVTGGGRFLTRTDIKFLQGHADKLEETMKAAAEQLRNHSRYT